MSNVSGGYNCQFVDSIPEHLEPYCKKCNFIVREPYQTECCGASFCHTCIQNHEGPCPDCGEKQLEVFADKKTKRQLSNYEVYCISKDRGCQWKGKLGALDDHLNSNPTAGNELTGCQLAQIKCSYCSQTFMRCDIELHKSQDCSMRPFSCEYCQKYNSHYEDVEKHWLKCSHFPQLCPNKCGEKFPRHKIVNHMRIDCPLQGTNCDYEDIGCKACLTRKSLPVHLNDHNTMKYHITLLARKKKELNEELNLKKNELATCNIQKDKLSIENEKLREENDKLKQQVTRLKDKINNK